jgi:hypothetical protein
VMSGSQPISSSACPAYVLPKSPWPGATDANPAPGRPRGSPRKAVSSPEVCSSGPWQLAGARPVRLSGHGFGRGRASARARRVMFCAATGAGPTAVAITPASLRAAPAPASGGFACVRWVTRQSPFGGLCVCGLGNSPFGVRLVVRGGLCVCGLGNSPFGVRLVVRGGLCVCGLGNSPLGVRLWCVAGWASVAWVTRHSAVVWQ